MTAKDVRPTVFDKVSKQWVLVDTGAACSVFPKAYYPHAVKDPTHVLKAVNGEKIATYGKRRVEFNFGGRKYLHDVIIADVDGPVLGWDFLVTFQIDLRWFHGQCKMHDPNARRPINLRSSRVDPQKLDLAIVNNTSFKNWSNVKNQTSHQKAPTIPSAYAKLLADYPDIDTVDFTVKPQHNVVHTIDTGQNKPCKAKARPIMPNSPRAIQGEKAWRELEKLGIIAKVNPQDCINWSSPLHLAPKTDGSLRPCGDFRALNDLTDLDTFPMPNLRHFSAKLQSAKIFSKLDLTRAYHQVPLCPDSQNKATVVTPWGAWRFLRLAMGLKNAAQSFQRLLMHVLDGIPNIFIYLDDVLVFDQDEMSHHKTLRLIFSKLKQAGLALGLSKCVFGVDSIDFLGYRVNKMGVTPLPRKIDAITSFPTPTRPKDLLGFLGAINFYRCALSKLNGRSPAEILQPLYKIATEKSPRNFKTRWQEANLDKNFKEAKDLITLACQLTHIDPSAPLSLTCDASLTSIGASLEQFKNGVWQPLGFWSRNLKDSERKWNTFKRELYAIQQALRHFLPEVEGRHLVIYTDHAPIIGAFKATDPMPYDPIARNQLIEISNFTSDIRFVRGKSNAVADFLSRPVETPLGKAYCLPDSTLYDSAIAALSTDDDAYGFATIDHKKLAAAQETCPDVASHRKGLQAAGLNFTDVEFSPGVWLYCDRSFNKKARPLVPAAFRILITRMFHDIAHIGQKETVDRIAARYYWPNMKTDISSYVSKCHHCNSCKPHKIVNPPLNPNPVHSSRFSELQVDIVGPLPQSEGYRYLLTILDRTTRWFEALPLKEATSTECAEQFIRGWVKNFGVPLSAKSDNGNTFIARIWRGIHAKLGTIISYSPLYSPSSLGGVERQHLDLKNSLKSILLALGNDHGDQWMDALPWVLLSRHVAFHAELEASPAECVYGENLRLPGDLPVMDPSTQDIKDLLHRLRANAKRPPAQTQLHKHLPVHVPATVVNATHVYVRKHKTTPLSPRYDGPFPLTERLGKSCIRIFVGNDAKGLPRFEVQHWRNCHPVQLPPSTTPATRPLRGRKPQDAIETELQTLPDDAIHAPEFVPATTSLEPTAPTLPRRSARIQSKAKVS